MKLKTNNQFQRALRAYTLIEMIGVLAVIAILAALLVPKVFSAINDARINGACISLETVKTATTDHLGKFGKLNSLGGTNDLPGNILHYDTQILMAEGLIDKPFSAKLAGGDSSTNCLIQLVAGAQGHNGEGYQLDGTNNATTGASYVLEAVLYNVAASDAKDLNDRIDGISLGDLGTGTDNRGRVEYMTNGTVYVYLMHR